MVLNYSVKEDFYRNLLKGQIFRHYPIELMSLECYLHEILQSLTHFLIKLYKHIQA